jgi:pantetheine-phosphate adenylyltransferase
MKKAIYPGSFDPFTNGHLDILERARKLFDEVTVLVADNAAKQNVLSVDDRVRLIGEVLSTMPAQPSAGAKLSVVKWSGLMVDYAQKHGITAVIRGLRAASDFEYEFMMAAMNKNLQKNLETVFMMTSQNLFFVSSSMVRELRHFGADIRPYVPDAIFKELQGGRAP